MGPNRVQSLIHGPENLESNLKSSTPYFTSNDPLLQFKGHPRLEFTCFSVLGALEQLGETGPK